VKLFEAMADEYDAFRPSYPAALYERLDGLLGGLDRRGVADFGAVPGIATRQLLDRVAAVTAVDASVEMLRRAAGRTSGLRTVKAEGASLLIRCTGLRSRLLGQSWHWIDQARAAT
jgi:trans-aconitate methyltransferase